MQGFGEKNESKKEITSKNQQKLNIVQLVKKAFELQSQGNILEAAKYYQNFINQGFNDYRVFSNYGVILKDLRKLQEAEFSYRKAIEIKPDFAEAKMNLDLITNHRVHKWHIPMMNDDERNNAYLKAIKSAIKNNEYVLEIGTGSGLLSMMAIDAGAKKVISCEVSKPIAEAAKKIIKKNGHSNIIEVINKKSTELNIHTDI